MRRFLEELFPLISSPSRAPQRLQEVFIGFPLFTELPPPFFFSVNPEADPSISTDFRPPVSTTFAPVFPSSHCAQCQKAMALRLDAAWHWFESHLFSSTRAMSLMPARTFALPLPKMSNVSLGFPVFP